MIRILALGGWFLVVGIGCAGPGGLRHEIEFEGPDGVDVFKLDPGDSDIDLEDGSGKDIGSYRLVDGVLRVENAQGDKVAAVRRGEEGGLEVVALPSKELMHRLLREPDGDLRLENGAGDLVYKLKSREYGFKVETADGQEHAKVRQKSSSSSVRGADGGVRYKTDDSIPAAATACLALDPLPLEIRAGLAVAMILWGVD